MRHLREVGGEYGKWMSMTHRFSSVHWWVLMLVMLDPGGFC